MTAIPVNQIGYTMSYTDTTTRTTYSQNTGYALYTMQLSPAGSVWWVSGQITMQSTATISQTYAGIFPTAAATGTTYSGNYTPCFGNYYNGQTYPANINQYINSNGVYVVDSAKTFVNLGFFYSSGGTVKTTAIYLQATRIA